MKSPNTTATLDRLTSLSPLDEALCRRKIDYILGAFHSQQGKHWFSRELFFSILRLRGMEANASSGYTEGSAP